MDNHSFFLDDLGEQFDTWVKGNCASPQNTLPGQDTCFVELNTRS